MSTDTSHVGLKTVAPGDYAYPMECPECGRTVHAAITLSSQLTVNDEGGKLRPTMRTKRVEHSCSAAETPPMLDTDGNVIPIDR